MQVFWLTLGILITVLVTYKSFTEGFNRWGFYYIFALLALFVFFIRRFMMKRMVRHQKEMEEKKNQSKPKGR